MNAPTDRTRAESTSSRERWWFAAISAATLIAYARSFTSPFQFDDYGQIVGAPAIQVADWSAFVRFARARLVPYTTLALNYRLGAEDPVGYHIVNFVIHLLATLAVFKLALALCRTPRLRATWIAGQRLPLAVAAGFLFACHPLQIEAVTYIVQRMTSMATMFYVAAVLFYVRGRNAQVGADAGSATASFALSIASALAAFFSKESTFSLPFTILLTEWVFFPGISTARRLRRLLPFLALALIIPLTWQLLGGRAGRRPDAAEGLVKQVESLISLMTFRANPHGQISPVEYFLTQGTVIPSYLELVVLPWGYNIDHDVPIARSITPAVAAAFAFLAALLAIGIFGLRRFPLPAYGILWLFLALSVESSFLPISDVMVERRMYLAMPGIALLAGSFFAWAHARWPIPARGAATVAVGALVILTALRNEVWRSPLTLWQDALAKSPGKARVYANVGAALHLAGNPGEAITYYCKARELDPTDRLIQSNIMALQQETLYDGSADDDAADEAAPGEADEDDAADNEAADGEEVVIFEGNLTGAGGEMEITLPDPCPPTPKR